jgi:hypothetical protein
MRATKSESSLLEVANRARLKSVEALVSAGITAGARAQTIRTGSAGTDLQNPYGTLMYFIGARMCNGRPGNENISAIAGDV